MFKELWKVEEEIYIIPYNRPFFLFFFPHQFCFSSNVFVCLHESLIWRNSKPSSSSIGKTTLSDSPEEDMIFTLRVISRINNKKKMLFFWLLSELQKRERGKSSTIFFFFLSFYHVTDTHPGSFGTSVVLSACGDCVRAASMVSSFEACE